MSEIWSRKTENATAWLTGRIVCPVYYEDTDFSGYVYHANYLKYFERAREELVGLDYVRELYERGIHYVVSRVELKYHLPAKHGDRIEIVTKLRMSEHPISEVRQEAHKLLPAGRREKLVSGTLKLVAVNQEGEAIRVPKDVLDYFASLPSEEIPEGG